MRRYGKWAANPAGQPEKSEQCIASVLSAGEYILHQCRRKRGHGEDGAFCKQHAKRISEGKYVFVPLDKQEVKKNG